MYVPPGDDEFVDRMPRVSDRIRTINNEKIAEAADKSSRDEILTVLCTVQSNTEGRGRDDKVEGCLPGHFPCNNVE